MKLILASPFPLLIWAAAAAAAAALRYGGRGGRNESGERKEKREILGFLSASLLTALFSAVYSPSSAAIFLSFVGV